MEKLMKHLIPKSKIRWGKKCKLEMRRNIYQQYRAQEITQDSGMYSFLFNYSICTKLTFSR